jgi:hypothetical protein
MENWLNLKIVLIAKINLPDRCSSCCGFCMLEYRVVYWEDTSGEFAFGTTSKTKFQQEINELAQEGWVVKVSNITALPQTNAERRSVSAYALLEREVIPAPFRGQPKTGSPE